MRRVDVRDEIWPLARPFRISRGSKTEAHAVLALIQDGPVKGWGECIPYTRYGETVESVVETIRALTPKLEAGMGREALLEVAPPGAARNAIDCALWDLEARAAGRPVWALAGLPRPERLTTAYTLTLDTPEALVDLGRAHAHRPLLKVKLDARLVEERVRAVHEAAPEAKLIVDANEGWTLDLLVEVAPRLRSMGVVAIEQPLPAGEDEGLRQSACALPLIADESFHDRASLPELKGRYAMVNIKLDKTGGLTEALATRDAARRAGFGVMAGSMCCTSLSLAPAILVGQGADLVDLDTPLLLVRDRPGAVKYHGSVLEPEAALWGTGR